MYLDRVQKELREYFDILCDKDYPEFINKYIELEELQRLKGIDQFCGCFYTSLFNNKYWYSRLDHSIATSLMAWHFTKDKTQTLSALFHDLGTPSFSHCVDFLLGDSIKQESSEKDVMDIIKSSDSICKYLKLDGIDINNIDMHKHSIVESNHPKLCVDRLDGIFSTCLIWTNYFSIEDIKSIYKDMDILINEDNKEELGFNKNYLALRFFNGTMHHAYMLQRSEDIYVMTFISDMLNELINKKYITYDNLYELSEEEIISILNTVNSSIWNRFINTKYVIRSNTEVQDMYLVNNKVKKRYAIPLIKYDNGCIRLSELFPICKLRIDEFMKYIGKKYCYVEDIKEKDFCIEDNSSIYTRKKVIKK